MKFPWMVEAFSFAKQHLPNLLQELGEGREAEAMEELARRFRAHRGVTMEDRTEQIEENRSEVDAKLSSRKKLKTKS